MLSLNTENEGFHDHIVVISNYNHFEH